MKQDGKRDNMMKIELSCFMTNYKIHEIALSLSCFIAFLHCISNASIIFNLTDNSQPIFVHQLLYISCLFVF